MVSPTQYNRVQYELSFTGESTLVIDEPRGWNDDEKEFARNKQYHGIFTNFSNNLSFVGNGAEYIRYIKALYGINAKIKMTKREIHPRTELWVVSYTGFLDLPTMIQENDEIQVKFNASGLEQSIKARENEKIEIERADTLLGREMTPLSVENLELSGREIFLDTKFDVSEVNNEADCIIESNAGGQRNQTCNIPLRLIQNSHQGIVQTTQPQSNATEQSGNLNGCFLFDLGFDRTFDINLSVSLDAFFQQYENIEWVRYQVCLTTYENGFDFDLKNRIVLRELSSFLPSDDPNALPRDFDTALPQFTKPMNDITYTNPAFEVLEGESVALEVFLEGDMFVDNNAGCRCFAQNVVSELQMTEDSFRPPTNTKAVMAHELGDRIVEIISDKENAFYSDYLGRTDIGYDQDGDAGLTATAHGMWIRQFDKLPETEDNKYKAFTTSWKDYFESLQAVHNIGVGIETVGFRERVRVEELSYFYNLTTTIKLPFQIKNEKRTVATDYFFSSVEIGYEKGGEYEEAFGLDEYNVKSTFITIVEAIQNVLQRISKYRADSYGYEFARRQPRENDPTVDTPYDKDIWLFNVKRYFSTWREKKWQDELEQAPENVFSPNTATNLTWSPFNLLRYKHPWVIASSLIDYPLNFIRYGSSEANSKLKTQLIGEEEYSENEAEVLNTDFGRARVVPEWIEFEHPVDFDLMQQVEGKSTILGREIRNVYGLVEFTNRNGDTEHGFLYSLKPNGNGEWKLLKANR